MYLYHELVVWRKGSHRFRVCCLPVLLFVAFTQ